MSTETDALRLGASLATVGYATLVLPVPGALPRAGVRALPLDAARDEVAGLPHAVVTLPPPVPDELFPAEAAPAETAPPGIEEGEGAPAVTEPAPAEQPGALYRARRDELGPAAFDTADTAGTATEQPTRAEGGEPATGVQTEGEREAVEATAAGPDSTAQGGPSAEGEAGEAENPDQPAAAPTDRRERQALMQDLRMLDDI